MTITLKPEEKSLEKTLKRLKAIEEISYACSTLFTADIACAAHKVIKPFCELTGADFGVFFLLKNPGNHMYLEASYGFPEGFNENFNKNIFHSLYSKDVNENWPSVRSILKKQIVIIKDTNQMNFSFSKYFQEGFRYKTIKSATSVPIIIQDEAVGAISKYYIEPHTVDDEELSFTKTTANIITGTIERNYLLETAKKSEKELAQANEILKIVNQELDSFVYIASHDLREPLRTIESFVSVLQDKLKNKLDISDNDYLVRIVRATQRMRKLIEDLTHLSRASRDSKEIEVVDLNNLLVEVQFELTAFIQNKNAELTWHNNLPKVIGSKEKISSLFKNLITNGLKFNKSNNPQVKISTINHTELYPNKVCICIEDNGIGIKEEYHKKIFDLFQRLHTQDEYEGTGAGLAIAKKIIEKYNCEIWVESKSEEGSKFFFTLPKQEE